MNLDTKYTTKPEKNTNQFIFTFEITRQLLDKL